MKRAAVLLLCALLGGVASAQTSLTNLPYVRFVSQVSTGPGAVLATEGMAEYNFQELQSVSWTLVSDTDSTIPPLNFSTNPLSNAYDAFKYASDYSSGKQNAYAGMVAYRFTVPQSAKTAASDIDGVSLNLFVDRWLVGGAHVAVYTSDATTPTTVWATARDGDASEASVLTEVSPRADQSTNVTVSLTSVAVQDFIYVVLTLEDYESVSPLDVRRLEGGAMIVGSASSFEFSASSLTADSVPASFFTGTPSVYENAVIWYAFNNSTSATNTVDTSGNGYDAVSLPANEFRRPVYTSYATYLNPDKEIYLESPAGIGTGLHDWTVAMWVIPSSVSKQAMLFSASSGSGSVVPDLYVGIRDFTGTMKLVALAPGVSEINATQLPVVSGWNHIALTYDKIGDVGASTSTARLYLNGTNIVSTVGSCGNHFLSISTNEAWRIAYAAGIMFGPVSTDPLGMYVDDFVVLSECLSTAQITNIVGRGRSTSSAWNASW